jgi:hypothetical protein
LYFLKNQYLGASFLYSRPLYHVGALPAIDTAFGDDADFE